MPYMIPRIVAIVVALFSLLTAQAFSADPDSQIFDLALDAEFLFRAKSAPYESIEDLVERPTKIFFDIRTVEDPIGRRVLRVESDYHVAYPLGIDKFLTEIADYENTANVFPSAYESVLVIADPDPFGRHAIHVKVGVRLIGFVGGYEYITNNYIEQTESGYVQKYNLEESPGGKFYQMIGSFYLEEKRAGDQTYTYIRNYSILGMKDSFALEWAMKTFAGMKMRSFFGHLYEAAQKR